MEVDTRSSSTFSLRPLDCDRSSDMHDFPPEFASPESLSTATPSGDRGGSTDSESNSPVDSASPITTAAGFVEVASPESVSKVPCSNHGGIPDSESCFESNSPVDSVSPTAAVKVASPESESMTPCGNHGGSHDSESFFESNSPVDSANPIAAASPESVSATPCGSPGGNPNSESNSPVDSASPTATAVEVASPESESMTPCGNHGGGIHDSESNSPVDSASPSAAAAVKVQKVYRSYRTRRRLADTAVVAEELWWQVLDYARANHNTISFFNSPETAASRWNRVRLNASKVGKGLSHDSKAQKLAFEHWIEAIDPRHRYGHNLHKYFEVWSKENSGQPFFYWLDVGDGKDFELEECPRSKLRQLCIKYLGPQEREHYEYIVAEGKIVHKLSGDLLDAKKASGVKWIFVMSTCKKLYIGEKKKGEFHHSSFLAGGATLAAGRLVVEHGILKSISAYSGHYRPTDDRLDSFLSFLEENGVNLDEVEIQRSDADYSNYEEKESISTTTNTTEAQLNLDITPESTETLSEEAAKAAHAVPRNEYKRTLSGGLQSPVAAVPKEAILERINSKKANTYELGHQLSGRWSTGAGPRIGCVADYPLELRFQALEFTALSPRNRGAPMSPAGYMSPRTRTPLSP